MAERSRLFCEISPLTYAISEKKCIALRSIRNLFDYRHISRTKQKENLEYVICRHTYGGMAYPHTSLYQ